eukprot:g31308.t1
MDIFQQVRTLVGLVSNAWSWSMRTNSTFRQVMPGLVRVLGAATLRRCRVVPPAAVWGKVSAGVATKGKAQLRLEHCTFQGWKSAAVCFRDDSDVTLKECRFEENPGTCISARNAASITVQQSSLTKNGGPVIQLRDATRLRLSESRLESNKGCGILVRGQAEAFIKSSCLEGHKMSAVAFQHQAKGSVLECRFETWTFEFETGRGGWVEQAAQERNDGAVVLVNGSAEVTVESNVFEKNGKSPPVLEFHGAAGPVKAKIEKDVNGLTHQLSYISGAEGSDWANLDESAQMIRNRAGETNVPYQIKDGASGRRRRAPPMKLTPGPSRGTPMRVGQQHDGEGGTLSGVNLQRGIKRSVLAVKDTAKATVRCNRMKANDGYGILVSDEAQAVMEENVLEEFKHAAIMLEGSASGVARTNTLSNNGGVGIQESNRIFQEKQPCIKVLGTSKSTIRQNYLLSSAARTARAAAAVLALDDAEVLVEENEVEPERQDLDVVPLNGGQKLGGRRPGQEAPVTDVALRTPTKSFAQIKVLLKLRWLLRLHSACCELDYKMCSLRNIILGMQYVVLQACAEAECDSLFDTKVQQNVGAHLHLESVLDDIADQLYRSLGKAHRAFLEYVASCDPMRSVHFSQIDSPLTPPQLAIALDTTFVSNFLRQSQRETTCTLQELYDDLEALSIPLPEIPPLAGAQNLRAWALAKTKPTPDSRQRGLGEADSAALACRAHARSRLRGQCKPCPFWVRRNSSCHFGARCHFCHLCGEKDLKIYYYYARKEERLKNQKQDRPATAGLPSPDQDLPRADDPEKGAWPAGPIPTPSSTATHRETTEPGIARVHADEEVPKTRAAPTGAGDSESVFCLKKPMAGALLSGEGEQADLLDVRSRPQDPAEDPLGLKAQRIRMRYLTKIQRYNSHVCEFQIVPDRPMAENDGSLVSPAELHERGQCKPCPFWVRPNSRCHFGARCHFCHLCGEKDLKIYYYQARKEEKWKNPQDRTSQLPTPRERESFEPGFARARADQEVPKARAAPTGVAALPAEVQDRRSIVNAGAPEFRSGCATFGRRAAVGEVPQNPSSHPGGAPEPINFGSTGRKPGESPSNAKIMYVERPQLSPAMIDAAVHIIQHHFTFPEGIRTRLHRLLFDEYGLTKEQAQNLEVASTTNIDGKRLTEDVLWNIDQKEKARLRKYFVDTGKDTSHLLAPALVPAPWMHGKPAK